jgi:hypothetical protein
VTRTISFVALSLLVAAMGVATAQAADDAATERQVGTAQDADDVAMEAKVRGLALRIGQAYACTDKKGRGEFQEEAHFLFDLILQDVGSDLAYTYATAVGIGSTRSKKSLDCPALLKTWDGIREDYELKGDE